MAVGEPGPLKQDDLSQAPPRSDGGGCLCGSADQRETGGGTSADPADPCHPASHLFHWYWIFLKISFHPFIKTFRSRIFQVLRSHWWFKLLLWLQKLWGFSVRHHLLCGLSAAAFHCCCSGPGSGWLQEELQCFCWKCQQGARVC